MRDPKRVKTSRSRAAIAIECMGLGIDDERFYACFEQGDKDAVITAIVRHASNDAKITDLLRRRGYGHWLVDDRYKPKTFTYRGNKM